MSGIRESEGGDEMSRTLARKPFDWRRNEPSSVLSTESQVGGRRKGHELARKLLRQLEEKLEQTEKKKQFR